MKKIEKMKKMKMKKMKNEKKIIFFQKKNEKWRKMKKKERKMKKLIQTQNPLRFPRFTVVVVTFFVKILDDFHDFVSECVSFPRKTTTRFGRSAFFRREVTIFIGRETKTHILHTKINEKIAEVSRSNNNYPFRII